MANPRILTTRLPLVVSIDRIASICASISWRFISAMSTGESMNATGSCGRVGASGQMCVATITSPGRQSPLARMTASLSAEAIAVNAPSPSDTKPIRSGRAPTPPRRPMRPRVGALPPADLPRVPGTVAFTKSVDPLLPSTRSTTISDSPPARSSRSTLAPSADALSSTSNVSRTCRQAMHSLHSSGPTAGQGDQPVEHVRAGPDAVMLVLTGDPVAQPGDRLRGLQRVVPIDEHVVKVDGGCAGHTVARKLIPVVEGGPRVVTGQPPRGGPPRGQRWGFLAEPRGDHLAGEAKRRGGPDVETRGHPGGPPRGAVPRAVL